MASPFKARRKPDGTINLTDAERHLSRIAGDKYLAVDPATGNVMAMTQPLVLSHSVTRGAAITAAARQRWCPVAEAQYEQMVRQELNEQTARRDAQLNAWLDEQQQKGYELWVGNLLNHTLKGPRLYKKRS
jgi:hypothetical protein